MNNATDPFQEFPNSAFDACFNQKRRHDIQKSDFDRLNTLSSISLLYIYSNPPPMGYGIPAPKVAESVLRAYDFNKKPVTSRTVKIGDYTVDNPVWDNSIPFPFGETASNCHPGVLHSMSKEFLKKNFETIRDCTINVISEFTRTNSDVLTKGRQTWDPLTERSVPCATAYHDFCQLLEDNGFPNHHTLIEFIQYCNELMDRDTLVIKKA